ncbi:MAG: hypothetical protein ICV68_05650, partial [Pyrinomonadaceae bacterium]|nr:hypothetical protein [Pyrinomonadaceae bacterium]
MSHLRRGRVPAPGGRPPGNQPAGAAPLRRRGPELKLLRRLKPMSARKLIVIVAVLLVAAGAWYAFRPERLFINQQVNEQFPVASAAAATTMTLGTGQF